MEFLKRMLFTFVLILAGITISATIFITMFYPGLEDIITLLWQIVILAAVCSLGNLIYYSKNEISKKQMKIRIMIHYLYTVMANVSAAYLFQWIKPGFLIELIVLIVLMTIVYISIMMVNNHREEKTAENMNKLLRKLHSADSNME